MNSAYAIALCALALAGAAHARPVSYPGGWTVIAQRDDAADSLLIHYTPHRDWSLGLRREEARGHDVDRSQIVATWLLQRWNAPQAQANLYLRAAAGARQEAHGPHRAEAVAVDGEVMADWETRRLFVSGAARLIADGRHERSAEVKARLGVAPYIGDYGDLHTWLMVEADWKPERSGRDGGPVIVRPLARFFYGVHLIEAGVSSEGEAFAQYILRL